ncbi:MAG: histidinol-phosphatase [Abditibacteriaceae bacterium]
MTNQVLYESHSHTPLCRHAKGEPEDYAEMALQRGLKGIIFTCHNPLPDGIAQGSRMYPEQFGEYVDLVARAREAYAGKVDVRLGLEADYMPGLESFLEKQLNSQEFHHVLGSVHPHLKEYKEKYFSGDVAAYQDLYFTHLADAAETGLFDTISHPDLVKNIFPDQWDLQRALPAILRALDRISATGVAMELNTSGLQKAISEMNPNSTMLREMNQRDIPIVIGADVHVPERVAADYESAMDLLETAGYSEIQFFLDRKPHKVLIEDARASLMADAIK